MNQLQFEQTYTDQWEDFQRLVEAMESASPDTNAEVPIEEFPRRYRVLCNHYGLAKARHYSPSLVDRLHGLVLRGHRHLYKRTTRPLSTVVSFIGRDFPRTLRRHLPIFWLAFTLFFLPLVVTGIATYRNPSLIYSLMNENQVEKFESMYTPKTWKTKRTGSGRAETDILMFGFYIYHNISIGFQTFATGMIFGIGSVFMLIYNGTTIGAAAGLLSYPPYSRVFWQFVLGHGALELPAIIISGTAGLLLGLSILRPGNLRRGESLRRQAPVALKLVMGAAAMFVAAAFIEAFWSPLPLPPPVKFTVAGCLWFLVFLYLFGAGRKKS